jgi:GntR family transcriptional regulator
VGQLEPGHKLPSAREMSVQVGMNPNTVIQAFAELERLGITETKRGKGTFVREDADTAKLKELRMKELIQSFLKEAVGLGMKQEEILKLVQENLR